MEHRAGGDPAEPALQEALDGAEAERGQDEVVEAIAGRRPVEVERRLRLARGALREQQADRLVGQAPGGEAEHRRARPVEPLHVVDGDDEGCRPGQRPQPGQRGEGDGLLVGLLAALGQEEGYFERAALRAGEVLQHLGVGAEEVTQGSVGEARLRLGGARGDHAHARRLRAAHRRLPQRRLADACLARDEQRPSTRGDGLEEPLHALQLLVSSDELGLHGGGGRAYPEKGGRSGRSEVGDELAASHPGDGRAGGLV